MMPRVADRAQRVLPILVGLLLGVACPALAFAQEYTIGPRDVLKITVWGQEDLTREYPVDQDGFVPFPLVGRVKAGGLTVREFAVRLTELLEKDYLVNPQVSVSVKEYLSRKVHVLGEAERPGLFYLTGPTTILEILSKAGGLSKTAGKQLVLVRSQPAAAGAGARNTIPRPDLDKGQGGDARPDKPPEGEVRKPGAYQLDRATTILEGITMAGGFTDKAAPGRTRVIRSTATGQQGITVDVNDIIKRGQGSKAMQLQENDVVVVPESFF